jgi:hypothetical protein
MNGSKVRDPVVCAKDSEGPLTALHVDDAATAKNFCALETNGRKVRPTLE